MNQTGANLYIVEPVRRRFLVTGKTQHFPLPKLQSSIFLMSWRIIIFRNRVYEKRKQQVCVPAEAGRGALRADQSRCRRWSNNSQTRRCQESTLCASESFAHLQAESSIVSYDQKSSYVLLRICPPRMSTTLPRSSQICVTCLKARYSSQNK